MVTGGCSKIIEIGIVLEQLAGIAPFLFFYGAFKVICVQLVYKVTNIDISRSAAWASER